MKRRYGIQSGLMLWPGPSSPPADVLASSGNAASGHLAWRSGIGGNKLSLVQTEFNHPYIPFFGFGQYSEHRWRACIGGLAASEIQKLING